MRPPMPPHPAGPSPSAFEFLDPPVSDDEDFQATQTGPATQPHSQGFQSTQETAGELDHCMSPPPHSRSPARLFTDTN